MNKIPQHRTQLDDTQWSCLPHVARIWSPDAGCLMFIPSVLSHCWFSEEFETFVTFLGCQVTLTSWDPFWCFVLTKLIIVFLLLPYWPLTSPFDPQLVSSNTLFLLQLAHCSAVFAYGSTVNSVKQTKESSSVILATIYFLQFPHTPKWNLRNGKSTKLSLIHTTLNFVDTVF